MTASDLIVACCSLGIRLTSENGKLAIADPNGIMTETFKARLIAHEAELETMVRTRPTPEMAAMVRDDGDAYQQARGAAAQHHLDRYTSNRKTLFVVGGLFGLAVLTVAAFWVWRLWF